MNWLDRAEQRFGHVAFNGLPWMVAALNLVVYMFAQVQPAYVSYLTLRWDAIMHGEVWRLVTFVFIPPVGGALGLFWFVLYLLFVLFVGNTLEAQMGAFRLNIYYLIGTAGVIAGAFIVHSLGPFGAEAQSGLWGNPILNLSLLFALAWYAPDAMILFMFIIPVKVKWIAWISAVGLAITFLFSGWAMKLALPIAFTNYILFFGAEIIHRSRERAGVADRRTRFQRGVKETAGDALHTCHVCHRTEIDSPQLEFRVARDGEEYCLEHLPKPPAAG